MYDRQSSNKSMSRFEGYLLVFDYKSINIVIEGKNSKKL